MKPLLPALALGLLLLPPSSTHARGRYRPENRELRPGPESRARAGELTRAEVLDRFARSWHEDMAVDLVFVPAPGVFFTSRPWPRNHGTPWAYDSHVPLFFYGPGQVRAVRSETPAARQYDIPATLAAGLGIPPPPASLGTAWADVYQERREPIRAILQVVMDQVGQHDLERFADQLPTLTRLRREGAEFTRCFADHVPTFTGVAHAGIGTGAPPWVHGICNNFVLRRPGADRGVVFRDPSGLAPHHLKVPTFADWMDRHYENRSVVISQVYADYAVTAVTGHGASYPGGDRDVVVYYDAGKGGLTTDPRYFRLPEYLAERDVRALIREHGSRYDGIQVGLDEPTRSDFKDFTTTRWFARWMADNMLETMVKEGVGRDPIPDLVTVNLKSTDAVGHQTGHGHPGYLDALREVDRFLASATRLLEQRAGRDRYVVVVTADHGLAPDDAVARYNEDLRRWLGERLDRRGDRDGELAILDIDGYHLTVDPAELADEGATIEDVRREILRDPHVISAWSADEVRARHRELGFTEPPGD